MLVLSSHPHATTAFQISLLIFWAESLPISKVPMPCAEVPYVGEAVVRGW